MSTEIIFGIIIFIYFIVNIFQVHIIVKEFSQLNTRLFEINKKIEKTLENQIKDEKVISLILSWIEERK